mgnify:CR=1 FL=1
MYIDIGANSKEDVENAGIRIGDPIIPRSDFLVLNNKKTYMSKAFDDRVGCALAIITLQKLLKIKHPNLINFLPEPEAYSF